MDESSSQAEPTITWCVDLEVDATVDLPESPAVARDAFLEWLWATADGLVGVDEGAVDVVEAAALGLVESPLVIDAAAAPVDRDWVGSLATARIACGFDGEAAARHAAAWLGGLRGCRVAAIRAETAHDANAWRDAFGPIEVAGFGTVRPAWEPSTAGPGRDGATIFIEPGVGFGTGLHETTRLCLAALAAWQRAGLPFGRVLDFGSGSGILGIAAAALGAREVDAVEIDATVHGAIRANAVRNGVGERVRVFAALPAGATGYDLVVANIVADVLLEHAANLSTAVRSGPEGGRVGGLVLSGLRGNEVDRVAGRYRALIGIAPRHSTLGDWHCLRFG
jgi:ribosomal protein L11 methyltransferase